MLPQLWWTTYVFTAIWVLIGIGLLLLRNARRKRRQEKQPGSSERPKDPRSRLEELERKFGRKG